MSVRRARWQTPLVVLVVALIWVWIDRRIGGVEKGGPYRQEIQEPLHRVERAASASHIVLGCSTSNWFPDALRRRWQLPAGAVVDAHMSDCHQACTMSEARRLVALGKHYQSATFGVNRFEYCEAYRERRVMQEVELLPIAESHRLLPIYLAAEDPLQHIGGWIMNQVSDVYGNTMWLQRHHRKLWFGNETLNANWFRVTETAKRRRSNGFSCDYGAADRRFGLAATRAALKAAEALASQVFLVVLPDQESSGDEPSAIGARAEFQAEHAGLIGDFERVHLISLLDRKIADPKNFRDGVHLNRPGIKHASRLLGANLPQQPGGSAP